MLTLSENVHIMLFFVCALSRFPLIRHGHYCGVRCMGWLIRFIHNRDLAAENIVTAYTRQRFVLSAPQEALQSLHTKMEQAGLTLPARSLLNSTKKVLLQKGALAGEFAVDVSRNSRKECMVNLTGSDYPPEIANMCKALFRTLGVGQPNLQSVTKLGDTIRINSRAYRLGDYVEFALQVQRTQSGRASTAETRGVGMIKTFYFVHSGNANTHTDPHLLVNIVKLPAVINTGTGMHKLSLAGSTSNPQLLLHVDSITFKLHRVPRPLNPDEDDDGLGFCYIRIWEAR